MLQLHLLIGYVLLFLFEMTIAEEFQLFEPIQDKLLVYALPVGQGDATVIQCPKNGNDAGRLTIVDLGCSTCHMTETELERIFKDHNVKNIFLTHADMDHYNRIHTLPHTENVYHSCETEDYEKIKATKAYLETKVKNIIPIKSNTVGEPCYGTGHFKCEYNNIEVCGKSIVMKVIAANLGDCNGKHTNSDSLVLRLDFDKFRLLLVGDLEDKTENNHEILSRVIEAGNEFNGIQSAIYRLAHHGSHGKGNKMFFLEAIAPTVVFSSSDTPPSNYNHPSCNTLKYLMSIQSILKYPDVGPHKYSCGHTRAWETGPDIFMGWTYTNYKGAWTNDGLTYAIYTTAPGYNKEGKKERIVILLVTGGTELNVKPIDIGEKYSYTTP